MRPAIQIWLVAVLAALLGACQGPAVEAGPSPAAPATRTAAPSATPSAAPASATPSAPPPTATAAPPTATPTPAATATAAPALSPTPFRAAGALLKTDGAAWSVAWSPDGRVIASGGEAGKMTLWEAQTGRRLHSLWVHSGFVESLSFSPDSARLASGSADTTIIIWNVATGRKEVRLEGHSQNVSTVAWSPDGRYLGVNRYPDPGLLLWDTASWSLQPEVQYSGRLFDVAWAPDGRLLATGTTEDVILFWDPATGEIVRRLSGHHDNVLQVAWSPDGRWLASRSLDERLYVWDVAAGQIMIDRPSGRGLFTLAWSPDSQTLAYGSLNGPLNILEAATGRYRFALQVDGLRSVAWSPDGAQLAAATGQGIWVWTISDALVPSPAPPPSPSPAPSPSSTPALLTAPGDGRPMVLIPAGPFLMGAPAEDAAADADERPQHTVSLDAYWIDQYEVSNAEYAACVQAGACQPPAELDVNGFPYARAARDAAAAVVNVTWDAAGAYCAWAGKRLPTEAEWEKAAHGPNWQLYPWGNADPHGKAWFCEGCLFDRSAPNIFDDFSAPAPVAGFFEAGASPYGVHNLAGNVWEWVADWYSDATYGPPDQVNPRGPEAGELRVVRGGAWTSPPKQLRTTYRGAWRPDAAQIDVGFRCALSRD